MSEDVKIKDKLSKRSSPVEKALDKIGDNHSLLADYGVPARSIYRAAKISSGTYHMAIKRYNHRFRLKTLMTIISFQAKFLKKAQKLQQ